MNLIFDGCLLGLPGHDVDHTADGAFAVDDRGRASQHFDSLDRPGVERKRDADGAVRPYAVVELRDRRVANEAAGPEFRAAVAGMGRGIDASRTTHRINDAGIAALRQLLAVDDLYAGGCFLDRKAQPAAGLNRFVERCGTGCLHLRGGQINALRGVSVVVRRLSKSA